MSGPSVDVTVERTLPQPRDRVAAYAADPEFETTWYANIQVVDWVSDPPLAVGTRIRRVAHFLGRPLGYTYEVTQLEPGHRMTMVAVDSPFPMQTHYTWEDAEGGCRMTLRNVGGPTGLPGRLLGGLMARRMRAEMTQDLARLEAVLADTPST